MLAMFLGVPAAKLVNMKLPENLHQRESIIVDLLPVLGLSSTLQRSLRRFVIRSVSTLPYGLDGVVGRIEAFSNLRVFQAFIM